VAVGVQGLRDVGVAEDLLNCLHPDHEASPSRVVAILRTFYRIPFYMGGLRELRSYGEPGAMVYLTGCGELMSLMPAGCVDVIFADPPYRLSGGGVSVQSGRLAPVDKGEWDRSMGFEKDRERNVR